MALTKRQNIARHGKMTGSRINELMSDNPLRVYRLWQELTGDPDYVPEDFEDNWQVKLGESTEQLHVNWVQKTHGDITQRGKVFQHRKLEWAAVTLDGWVEALAIPLETKHNNGFERVDEVIRRYQPQLHWTMYCTSTDKIMFSIIRGAREPEQFIVPIDNSYMFELFAQAEEFMVDYVRELREPVANPFIKPPKIEAVRTVDMTGNNLWAAAASRWKENAEAKKAFDFAAKEIKEATPQDAKEAYGHGIRAKRNKAGALTISEDRDEQ